MHDPIPDQPRQHPQHFGKHLQFSELIQSIVVAFAAAQACQYQAVPPDNPAANIGAAEIVAQVGRETGGEPGKIAGCTATTETVQFLQVVIAEHKEYRLVQHAGQESEVFHWQIPSTYHHLYRIESFFGIYAVYQRVNMIGDAQYFHKVLYAHLFQQALQLLLVNEIDRAVFHKIHCHARKIGAADDNPAINTLGLHFLVHGT